MLKDISISSSVFKIIPSFQCGVNIYRDIVIDDSPGMLRGRVDFFHKQIQMDLLDQSIYDYTGVRQWQQILEQAGLIDRSLPPLHEQLYKNLQDGTATPSEHSGEDLIHFFNLQYETPIILIDADTIFDYLKIGFGVEQDELKISENHVHPMYGQIIAKDRKKTLGSLSGSSLYSRATRSTTTAIQLTFMRPQLSKESAAELTQAVGDMFTQIHGGTSESRLLRAASPVWELSW